VTRVDDLIKRYYNDITIGRGALEQAIHRALQEGKTRALDAGCGWDAPLTRKFSEEAWVVGLDLSRQLPRDLLTICGDLAALPFRDQAFSLVFSSSVFEHLSFPDNVIAEFHRILQPGGLCVILTPNRYDYSSLVATLTPQVFHKWFVTRLYGAHAYDTFPTLYRANSPRYFERFVRRQQGKWDLRELRGLRHYPANLMFSRILFRLGIFFDSTIAKLGLRSLQPSLLVILEKAQ
jgi:SAM-dependent methyltransferase